jgi:hypothetical protein
MKSEIEEIRDWLNSQRDINAGLMIYRAYIGNDANAAFIERQQDSGRLFEALRKRFFVLKDGEMPTEQSEPTTARLDVTHLVPEEKRKFSVLVPVDLDNAWRTAKTEQEALHLQLRTIGEGKTSVTEAQRIKRAELAAKIVEKEKELAELGGAYEYFKEYGQLPESFSIAPKAVAAPLSDVDTVLRLKNIINPTISKLRKSIADGEKEFNTLSSKAKDKKATKIDAWKKKLADLEAKKKRLTNGA